MTGVLVERVDLRLVSLELAEPFQTSFGVLRERHCVIVSVSSGGVTGWGECVAMQGKGEGGWAFYSYETTETAWHILRDFLVPEILGRSVASPRQVVDLGERLRGHPMARAALEAAIWDLLAKARQVPLADLLAQEDGRLWDRRDKVPVGVSVGIQASLADTLNVVASYLEQGYLRVKLKIQPGWDVEVVEAVRRAFPDAALMVDANSAYHLEDAEHLKKLDEFNLMMIEQPLGHDDIYEHSLLQKQLKTPICLDESIHTPRQAAWAYEIGACEIINIKPARVAGLWAAREIHDLSVERGKAVWCGGMLETGIGRAANVALASLPGFTLPGDISASERYYREDLVDPPFALNPDGTISVPHGPGIGVAVRRDVLNEAVLRRETLRARVVV